MHLVFDLLFLKDPLAQLAVVEGVAVQVIPLDRLEGEVGPVAEHVDGRVYVVDLADAE